MKKLGKIEDPIEFLNAIMEGANVNEKKNGVPMIQYCFKKTLRYCEKCDSQQMYLDKVFYLLSAGADIKSLVGDITDPFYYDFDSLYKELVSETIIHLELLNLILKSQPVKDAILENEIYWDRKAGPINFPNEMPTDELLKKMLLKTLSKMKYRNLLKYQNQFTKEKKNK